MKHNLSPTYLSALVPRNIGSTTRYSLRNSNDLQTIHSRTTLYSNSLLSSTVRDWTICPRKRKIDTINTFKELLNRGWDRVPMYYFGGSRRELLHTRLQTNVSGFEQWPFSYSYQNRLFVNAKMLTIISLNVPFTHAIVLHCLLACQNFTT